jgi:hypothetical protein
MRAPERTRLPRFASRRRRVRQMRFVRAVELLHKLLTGAAALAALLRALL